jgi:glycosyltransferase involved in cell wall biosynthesis
MYLSLRSPVLRLADEFRPDVLLVAWAYPDAVAAAALARRLALPWLAEVLGSDINVSGTAPLLRAQIRWALRQASCTLAVSAPLKQRLVEIGVRPETIRVHHNGVDTQRFRLLDKCTARSRVGLPAGRNVILYVGNVKVSKGVEDLIEAAKLLTAERNSTPLVVLVGGGAAQNRLTAVIRRCALTDDVRLVGPRPHEEIPDWMAAADALCLPSHNEGCPNVVIEALACGRPVVATNVGAIPDFIDEGCGFLVPPQEPAQLATALRAVTSRNWEASSLRARVLPLSWEENARILAAELKCAARSRARSASQGEDASSFLLGSPGGSDVR